MDHTEPLSPAEDSPQPQPASAKVQEKTLSAEILPKYLRHYSWWMVLVWTLVVGLSLWWNLSNQTREFQQVALTSARISAEKDFLYRKWAIMRGGVYVPVTPNNPPNPYLAHLPVRDILSLSGQQLTLIPPATMIQQVYGLEQKGMSNRVHITSLTPLEPRNAPDPWERLALQAFQQGQKEIHTIELIDGQPYFRLMRPYTVQKGCIKCHRKQEGQEGETYGALSVAVPIAPMLAAEANNRIRLWVGHGILWLLGMVGIGVANRRLNLAWRSRDQAEQALQESNVQLHNVVHEYRRVNQEISLINDLTDQLHACFNSEEAFHIIERLMPQLFPGFSGGLLILNASSNYLDNKVSWGTSPPDQAVVDPQTCWALRRGRVYLMEDPKLDILCDHLSQPLAAGYLCVPMTAHGETLGIFHLRFQAPESGGGSLPIFPEDRQRLATTVAAHLALSLGNLKLQEVLRHQAIRDPLTGLYNRRFMMETLEREIYRMQRKKGSLAIMMLDLDHFKRFNDTFGHSAGDVLLSALGRLLLDHVRKEDVACRYGGEEFTLILPETSLETAHDRAEELRRLVHGLHLEHHGQSLGGVTISLGVAGYPQHGENPEALLRAADRALYQAKHTGRDRVVAAEISVE